MAVQKTRLLLLVAAALIPSACASNQYGTPGENFPESDAASTESMAAQGGFAARTALRDAAQGGEAGTAIGRQMDEQAAELENTLIQGATVERVSEGIHVTIAAGSLYGFESSVLRDGESAYLRHLAASLMKYPDTQLLIVGHTDDSGGNRYTQALSTRRANATSEYLAEQGVMIGRMQTVGKGMTEPVATNSTETGKRSNRRIEVAIYARATASIR